METRARILAILAILALGACEVSTPYEKTGSGGEKGSGGSGSGGTSASGGSSGSGGTSSTGGSSATGGSSNTGGTSASGGTSSTGGKAAGGTTGSGGRTIGGRTGTGGITSPGGTSGGGVTGGGGRTVGGRTGNGGATGPDAGTNDSGAPEVGSDTGSGGGSGGFEPCPTNGDPCKVLPLGDSITWGINYGGGYRIKLFTHTVNDQKNITFVGYDTGNNADANALSKLGSAKDKWVNKHEGHSGWTIQQDDDLVTGKSTATNDGVNYKGKKVVADFNPHIVLVHLGTNDMYQNPSGADTRLGTLIDHIVADAPDALVVVSNIIPFPMGASAVTTFNNAVPGVVKKRTDAGKHVVFADQFKGFQTSDLGSDQVHPNEGGYEKMAVVWYDIIKPYLH